MTIKDYIQSIVSECFPSASYHYGRNTDFNIDGDNTAGSVVLCIEPDQMFLNLSSLTGNVNDGYNLFVRFLELTTMGEQADSRVTAIANQKANAGLFLSQLSQDDVFIDLPAKIPCIAVIDAYDANWCGVEINLQNLQTIKPFDICL